MQLAPSPIVAARVATLLGAQPVAWQPIGGGYTPAQRWRVRLVTGAGASMRAFVKVAVDDETAAWLRAEERLYAGLRGDFLPQMLGWDDPGHDPLLILEDLGEADWPALYSGGFSVHMPRQISHSRQGWSGWRSA